MNCAKPSAPVKHTIEARTVRQSYNVAKGEIEHKSVKYRIVGVHVETQKGDIETGNPYGSTEKYSVLRYEEEVDGKIIIVIDATAGVIKFFDKDYTDVVNSMLK